MKAKLSALQKRRSALTKEIKLLGQKEEELLIKIRNTEAVLEAHQENARPESLNQAQLKLLALEKMIEGIGWSKDLGLSTQVRTLGRPDLLEGRRETPSLGDEPNLNHVRINQNVSFSWSYKRLP